MAAAKVLFESFRYTVVCLNDSSIEIAPKDDPRKARIFRTLESDILDAYHRDGFAGVDRLCDRLFAKLPDADGDACDVHDHPRRSS